MLREWKATEKPEEGELKKRLIAARDKLARQQMLIKEKKVPVLVLMEGWGTAGKGSCIGEIIQNIDPRFSQRRDSGTAGKVNFYFSRCQISRLYSAMVRSLENIPAFAMLIRHLRRHPIGSQA